MTSNGRWRNFLNKARFKYRLIIRNEENFEEKFNLMLSRLNVFIVFFSAALVLVVLTVFIIAYTPLREYIPGYGDVKENEQVYRLMLKTDSLQKSMNEREVYLKNIHSLLLGLDSNYTDSYDQTLMDDSKSGQTSNDEKSIQFLSPLKGNVVNTFEPSKNHFGVDIVSAKNSPIKNVAEGMVVFSGFTTEGGNTIIIQHAKNTISVYKHNSTLYKKQGQRVKTGETIALIGNSGEQSTGPHLHFELWIENVPVNPTKLIHF